MAKPRKRKAANCEENFVNSKRTCPPLIVASEEIQANFEQAKEAEQRLYSQQRELPGSREAYFLIISLLYLSVSLLGVSHSLFYGAADVLYCFFLSQKLEELAPRLSDVVYASIVIASELRAPGCQSQEELLTVIFRIEDFDFKARGFSENMFMSFVREIRATVARQVDLLRWGARYFLDFHAMKRNLRQRTGNDNCFRLAEFVLEGALHDARLGEIRDSLKAIAALDIAVAYFGHSNVCSSWLPGTPEYDPRGAYPAEKRAQCYRLMEEAFFKTMNEDHVFNERLVDFLKAVVSVEKAVFVNDEIIIPAVAIF